MVVGGSGSTNHARELLEKIDALGKNQRDTRIIDRIYAILSTLDAKANGLLRVNSIFIAILMAFLGLSISDPNRFQISSFWQLWASADLGLVIVSSVLCLFVGRISWRFLGKTTCTNEEYFFEVEKDDLAMAACCRTQLYRWAWALTFVGLLGLFPFAVYLLS